MLKTRTKVGQRIADRWDDVTMPEPNTGCLLWMAGVNSNGYGQICVNGKGMLAHRHAYERVNGPIPGKLWVLHRCDTPACVNPEHLFLGTVADNNRDMREKGRFVSGFGVSGRAKTHCRVGHELSGANIYTYVGTNGSMRRHCKTCMADSQRRRASRRAQQRIQRRLEGKA